MAIAAFVISIFAAFLSLAALAAAGTVSQKVEQIKAKVK